MDKSRWVWMPHPGHFICSQNCKFILNTYVGKYIVSTVGEYVPDSSVREILAESREITLVGKGDARLADYMEKVGYETVGLDRKYETMVFHAKESDDKCCPFRMKSSGDIDFAGYNESEEAFKGHYKMCLKWSKK